MANHFRCDIDLYGNYYQHSCDNGNLNQELIGSPIKIPRLLNCSLRKPCSSRVQSSIRNEMYNNEKYSVITY